MNMCVLLSVTKFEIECLLKKFRELTSVKLDRTKFRDILHKDFDMTDDIIMDRGRQLVRNSGPQ